MKNLFAVFLSLHLILSPLALAQETPGQQVGLTDEYLKSGTGDGAGGYDFYVNQISMLSNSAVGSSIMMTCPAAYKIPSMDAFFAGSLAHFGKELLGAKSQTERNKKKLSDLSVVLGDLKTKGDSAQKEALGQYLQEEKDNLEVIRNHKNWMIAVTAIYTAASALAVAEEIYSHAEGAAAGSASCATVSAGYSAASATATCASSCAAATVGYAACTAACYPGAYAGFYSTHMAACELNMSVGAVASEAAFASPEAFSTGTSACTGIYIAPCNAYHKMYMLSAFGYCNAELQTGAVGLAVLIPLAYGFISSAAGFKAGKISGYGSILVTLLATIVPGAAETVVPLYNFPIPRAATFGASATMAGVITGGLMHRENLASRNVASLTTAFNQFVVETSGNGRGMEVGSSSDTDSNFNNSQITKNKEIQKLTIKQKKECFSNSGSNWDHSAASCSRPLKLSKTPSGKFNTPALNKVAGLATDMAQNLADGNISQAGQIAGEIGSMAARVKQEANAVRAQYNDLRKKRNQSPIDFDKSVNERVAALQGSFDKAMSSNNISKSSLGSPTPTSPQVQAGAGSNSPVIGVPSQAAPAFDPFTGMDSSQASPDNSVPTVIGKSEQSLDDFESPIQDISKKSDVSIFKQLSNRYILNYMKIFEAKKAPESASPVKKN